MAEYIVSARKYRPVSFDTVVGQRGLTTTLNNAIASGKLAHAYLFCGPRGVGKTTSARIFAKAINCLNPTQPGCACGKCESCLAFEEKRSFNIHELDAASNNSVEDIRLLIDEVRIPPQIGKYKVFIIDEVHMLSQAAFNAFLKTLEEPPSHVIFILATTEKHKILPTILSRCQVYDFNRISNEDIVEHLRSVAQSENYTTDDEALAVIAEKADGGMRDALSIFDQVAAFTSGDITYDKVIAHLGMLNTSYYFNLVELLLSKNISQTMLLLDEVLRKGFDGGLFIGGLSNHLRNVLISKDAATLPLLNCSDKMRNKYSEQAKRCSNAFLYRALKTCNTCDINYKQSRNKRLLVEITLIQVAQADDDPSSGHCPANQIKPVFESGQSSGQNKTNSTQAQVPEQGRNIQASINIADKAAPAKAPLPKVSLGISISQSSTAAKSEPVVIKASTNHISSEAAVASIMPWTDENLKKSWFVCANKLAVHDPAMAQRMRDTQPQAISPGNFSIEISSQQILPEWQTIKEEIQNHISNDFGLNQCSMQFNIAEKTQNVTRNRVELFSEMIERNPSLAKLKMTFNLDFA